MPGLLDTTFFTRGGPARLLQPLPESGPNRMASPAEARSRPLDTIPLREKMTAGISSLLGDTPDTFRQADKLTTLLEILPGIGNVTALQDAEAGVREGDIPKTLLGILGGVVGGVPGAGATKSTLGRPVQTQLFKSDKPFKGKHLETIRDTADFNAGKLTTNIMIERPVSKQNKTIEAELEFDIDGDMDFSDLKGRAAREEYFDILGTVQNSAVKFIQDETAKGNKVILKFEPATPRLGKFYERSVSPRLTAMFGGDLTIEKRKSALGAKDVFVLNIPPGKPQAIVATPKSTGASLRDARTGLLRSDLSTLEDAEKAAGTTTEAPGLINRGLSSVDIVYNPKFAPAQGGGKLAAQTFLHNRATRALGGRALNPADDTDFGTIVNTLTEETRAAFLSRGNANQWYKDTLTKGVGEVARVFPEVATDPVASDAFRFALAITSNGQRVATNGKLALEAYSHYRATGKFPPFGVGRESNAMRAQFEMFNELSDKLGTENVFKFLNSKFTVSQLRAAGFKVPAQEAADEVVYGSYLFGAKLGNGFYQNLRGNFDQLTADRWFTRTWGRVTGTLLRNDDGLVPVMDRFKDAVAAAPDDELARFLPEGVTREQILTDEEELTKLASYIHTKWAGEADATRGTFGNPTALKKTARNIDKLLSEGTDLPSGPGQRADMRRAIREVQSTLRRDGIELDVADIQALLWFPEKDLYQKLGVRIPNREGDDYASVLKQLVDERVAAGGSPQGRAGRGGEQPSLPDDAAPGSGRGAQAPGAGLLFEPNEARRFLRERTLDRARTGSTQVAGGGDPAGQPGPFREGSPGTAARSLRKLASVVNDAADLQGFAPQKLHALDASTANSFRAVGMTPLKFAEFAPTRSAGRLFHKAISDQIPRLGVGGQDVSVFSPEDYAGMRTFLTPNAKAGFAITKDGEIASVFSSPDEKGTFGSILTMATQAGGKWLNAFDHHLTRLYREAGFTEVARTPFNPEFKPDGWDIAKRGKPDVVFMVYDPDGAISKSRALLEKAPTLPDYDAAEALTKQVLGAEATPQAGGRGGLL